jgi:NADH-quinone oxidoreductase subunit K
MSAIPLEHGLVLAAAIFAIGLAGVLIRRNILFILLSIEIMLNGAGLAFVLAGARWYKAGAPPDGQVMFILILSVTAAEVSVGLALVLRLYHGFKTLDSQAASRLRG